MFRNPNLAKVAVVKVASFKIIKRAIIDEMKEKVKRTFNIESMFLRAFFYDKFESWLYCLYNNNLWVAYLQNDN